MQTFKGQQMKNFIILTLLSIAAFGADTIINTKKCETLKISNYTTLISCHDMSYLIEYREVRRDDEDIVKKITIITQNDSKVVVTR